MNLVDSNFFMTKYQFNVKHIQMTNAVEDNLIYMLERQQSRVNLVRRKF